LKNGKKIIVNKFCYDGRKKLNNKHKYTYNRLGNRSGKKLEKKVSQIEENVYDDNNS